MKNHFSYIHGYLLLSTLILFITCTQMAFTASIGLDDDQKSALKEYLGHSTTDDELDELLVEEAALLPEGESSESDTDADIAALDADALDAELKRLTEESQKAFDADIAALDAELKLLGEEEGDEPDFVFVTKEEIPKERPEEGLLHRIRSLLGIQ